VVVVSFVFQCVETKLTISHSHNKVDENYHVKVADFGLSKVSVTGNTYNSKVGSLNWCAPEILLNSMPYTDKADVYRSFAPSLLLVVLTHPDSNQLWHGLVGTNNTRSAVSGNAPFADCARNRSGQTAGNSFKLPISKLCAPHRGLLG